MKRSTKTLLALSTAALLGLGSTLVLADPMAPMGGPDGTRCGPMGGEHARHLMERMGQRQEKHQAMLKAALKLSPEQENAWNRYVEATHFDPRAHHPGERQDWSQLTTPQRLDQMEKLRTEHSARMTQRIEATRQFYAALTPEQQQVFDHQFQRRERPGPAPKHGPETVPKG